MSTHSDQPSDRLLIVAGSVRAENMSRPISEWVQRTLRAPTQEADPHDPDIDLLDLALTELPEDRALAPGGSEPSSVAERLDAAAGFVFVTPEYNHSYPAGLKRLIDWHYREWMLKPALIVSYGVQGGHAAAEHLRGVLAELNAVSTRRAIALPGPWGHLDAGGDFSPTDETTQALRRGLAELLWWSRVLTPARDNGTFPA